MTRLYLRIFILSVFYYTFCFTAQFESGKYKLLIRIDNSIEPHQFEENVLVNLKKIFKNASSFLHMATKCMTFFHNITIVLPYDWPQLYPAIPWKSATDKTDMIVVKNLQSQFPAVQQTLSCGQPGDVMYIPLQFLSHSMTEDFEFSIEARSIVQQWARLRYGVFEEHGWKDDPIYPIRYWNHKQSKLTSCSNEDQALTGKDPVTSIMYNIVQPSVTQFCNETNHNIEAPNRQNILCNYKSVWDIIEQHQDLKHSAPMCNIETNPFINVVQQKKLHLILVIDSSQSMENIIEPLYQALSILVLHYFPSNNFLTIIEQKNGNVQHPVLQKEITNDYFDRKIFLDHNFPVDPSGAPNEIGALKLAIQIWSRLEELQTVVFMLFNDDSGISQEFRNLVEYNNEIGFVFFHLNAMSSFPSFVTFNQRNVQEFLLPSEHEIGDTMTTMLTEKMTQYFIGKDTLITIKNEIINGNDHFFFVDGGSELIFIVIVSITSSIRDIILIPPADNPITLNHHRNLCSDEKSFKLAECRIMNPETGQWRFSIIRDNSPQDVRIKIKLRCARNSCLSIKSWMNTTVLKHPFRALIFVKVQSGDYSTANVTVVATIRHSTGTADVIQLHDKGQDPDIISKDGIYTAYISPMHRRGYYFITVTVNGIIKINSSGKNRAIPFQRTDTTGSLYIDENLDQSTSVVWTPMRVLDLRAQFTQYKKLTGIKLTWTAPETATTYDIRRGLNRTDLIHNFQSAKSIPPVLLPTPLSHGELQEIFIPLDINSYHCYGLKVLRNDKPGDLSNIACANPLEISNPSANSFHSTEPTIRWIDKLPKSEDETFDTLLISLTAGCAIAFAALAGIVIALVVVHYKYQLVKKRGSTSITERQALRVRQYDDTMM